MATLLLDLEDNDSSDFLVVGVEVREGHQKLTLPDHLRRNPLEGLVSEHLLEAMIGADSYDGRPDLPRPLAQANTVSGLDFEDVGKSHLDQEVDLVGLDLVE